jgi:hypothetical protein
MSMFNLATILRESAAGHPDEPVACWDGGRLTYAELGLPSRPTCSTSSNGDSA